MLRILQASDVAAIRAILPMPRMTWRNGGICLGILCQALPIHSYVPAAKRYEKTAL
jgi:hypothetical protein